MFHFIYLKLTVLKSPGNSWGSVQQKYFLEQLGREATEVQES